MKEFRNPKGVTERYTSLEDLRAGWNLKPIKKKTTDEEKLKEQQEKFVGTCPYCKTMLSYVGGNIIVCKNEACKGRKIERENEDGTKDVVYRPFFKMLDEKGEEIASRLFG